MKNRSLRKGLCAAALALTACLPAAQAATIVQSFSDIAYWVGSGSNQAAVIIDWNDGTGTDSYAWGFRWNGTATGQDMLEAIAGAIGTGVYPNAPGAAVPDGTGDPALTLFTQAFPDFGDGVYQLDYLSHSAGGFDPDSPGFWAYYTGTTGTSTPGTWTFSELGMGDRSLVNNSWDGWSWAPDFNNAAPGIAVAAVPEPATLALAALGIGAFILLRRRAHA